MKRCDECFEVLTTKVVFCRFPKQTNELLFGKKVFIITDKNVHKFYSHCFGQNPYFAMEPGEDSKCLEEVFTIYRWLISNNAGRDAFVLGVGGGVVCDLAGFVAATFMRGVSFGFISTSLLSQVDASVGGKNGVNFDGFKNLIGTIVHPEFVVCDTQMLSTLPEEEYSNGLAEVVKHAILSGADFIEFLENNIDNIRQRNPETLEFIVRKSVEVKTQIVIKDDREKHIRKILNLGHTLGHALELSLQIRHGLAVSVGIAFAADISFTTGYLSYDNKQRIIQLLERLNLPTFIEADLKDVVGKILHDKKRFGNSVDFIFIRNFGDCFIEPIPLEVLEQKIAQFYKNHEISG